MKTKLKILHPVAAAMFLLAGAGLTTASAQISVGDTLNGESFEDWTEDPTTLTTSGSISAGSAANSILLVAVGSTQDNLTSVSYGGQSLTQAVASTANFRQSSIWYLTDPGSVAASSQISFTTGSVTSNPNNNELFGSAAVFSGVDLTNPFLATDSEAQNNESGDLALEYNLGDSPVDTVYFESAFFNGGAAKRIIGNELYVNEIKADDTFAEQIQGYTIANGVSGTVSRNFEDNGSNNISAAGGALAAIPEPSTFALFAGALGLSLVMLRRRRS